MKRKLSDSESKESQQPYKREKLADVVIPTIQERVMENDNLTGIIGSFLEPKDKTAYCQTARINLADGPFVHPSKVDMSFCALMGCRTLRPDVDVFLCSLHKCSAYTGKIQDTDQVLTVYDSIDRHLKTFVIDVGANEFRWKNPTFTHVVKSRTPEIFQEATKVWLGFLYREQSAHEHWTAGLQKTHSPLIRRFVKNRRRFKPGERISLGTSSAQLRLECDQLGMVWREEAKDSN